MRLFTAWGEPSELVTGGVLAAIAVGIGSQYLPRRLPLGLMARFSRLPVPAQAVVLSVCLARRPRARPRRRRPLHLLPVLMERRRRRPRGRIGEDGRKLHSAGSAVVVCVLALGLAALLNAPGIHKSATIQEEGWKRDLALAFTGPLKATSDALLLDQPRRGLKALAGRSDDDEIDTGIALPEAARRAGLGRPAEAEEVHARPQAEDLGRR